MADDTQAVETPLADAAPVAPAATPAADAPAIEADSIDKLPKWAQNHIKELRQESASHRKAKTELEKATEEAARKLAEEQGQYKPLYEAEKASREAAELRARAAELDRIKVRIGSKLALPAELQDRLRGETEEEIEADAKLLLAAIPKPAPITATDAANGGNPTAPTVNYTDDEIREMAAQYNVSFEALKLQLVRS